MSSASGASVDHNSTSRPMPNAATSSTSQATSSSLTTSSSVSTSASSSSSTSTTSSSSTSSASRVSSTTQSQTETSTAGTTSLTTTSRESVSQSSQFQTSTIASSTTNAGTTPSQSSWSSTTTLRQHGTFIREDSTSVITVTSYVTLFPSQTSTSQSLASTGPTTTSTPVPVATGGASHQLIIDLGECAGFASPRITSAGGKLGDPVALGIGRYALEMKTEKSSDTFGLLLSLKDDGRKCGSGDDPSCATISLYFGASYGATASVLRAGDYSADMYPFSIWMEDGTTWGGEPANSPQNMYHCWGWKDQECPYVSGPGIEYTVASDNLAGGVYVGFCPSDGPKWSSIPANSNPQSYIPTQENTYVILPTRTVLSTSTFLEAVTPTKVAVTAQPSITTQSDGTRCDVTSTCFHYNTFISVDFTSTIRSEFLITPSAAPTQLFSTAIVGHTTSTVPQTTFLNKPTPIGTLGTVEPTGVQYTTSQSGQTSSTLTEGPKTRRPTATSSSGSDTNPPISSPIPTVVPTYSDLTDSLGSVFSTLSYDVTVSPAPTITSAPESQYVITSWTTWMTVNGSTVPAIAGEVGVLSTIPITYMLEPSTTIAVAEISSISVESTRTSSPSPTVPVVVSSDQSQAKENQGGKIAGAVVGALVGLVLGSLLLWYICYRRQRRQRKDYFARGDPAWLSPSHANASGGGSRLLVDLDEEPRMRDSYVEPWVPPTPVPQASSRGKASQREMESAPGGYGVSTLAGPSRDHEASSNEGSSWFQHESSDNQHVFAAVATRPGKAIARSEPPRRPDVTVPQRPAPSHYRTPSLANPSMSLLPTPFRDEPPSPDSPPSRAAMLPNRVSPPPRAGPSQRRYVDDEEQLRHNAIPPLYNEAWNTGR